MEKIHHMVEDKYFHNGIMNSENSIGGLNMNTLIGEIRLFPYENTPEGWLVCKGQTLYIAEYSKLYMLIGIRYGYEGKHKFKLPDLSNQAPDKMQYYIAVEGEFPHMCV